MKITLVFINIKEFKVNIHNNSIFKKMHSVIKVGNKIKYILKAKILKFWLNIKNQILLKKFSNQVFLFLKLNWVLTN